MSNPSVQDETGNFEGELVLRAAAPSTRPWAWGFIGFFVIFAVLAGSDGLIHGKQTLISTFGLPASIIAGILVGCWPRPRFMKEIHVTQEGIRGVDRDGMPVTVSVEGIDLISVEGQLDLMTLTYSAWGRLHIRAGKVWIAMQMPSAGAKDCFAQLLRRCPYALGVSGDQQVEVPAIKDPAAAEQWLTHVQRQCRRELGRQFRFALCCALTLALGTFGIWMMMLSPAGADVRMFRATLLECSTITLLGVVVCCVLAWRRHRFRARILAHLAAVRSVEPDLPRE